jgi:hypothetical protein
MPKRRSMAVAKLAAWNGLRDSGFARAVLHVDMHRLIHSRVLG